MQSQGVLAYAAFVAALAAGAMPSYAQYPDDFHSLTFDGTFGRTGVHGADQKNFGAFLVYGAGVGFSCLPKPGGVQYTAGRNPTYSHWNLFVTADFLYGNSKFKGSLTGIVYSNPQTPSVLSATNGTGGFYTTTAGPRLQYSWRLWNVYGQAEGGWLRRALDLTGPVTEGTGLQPNSPSVFRQAGNSGALRMRAGAGFGAKGVRVFGEIGLVQGFAINHGTMLAPILSGGIRW